MTAYIESEHGIANGINGYQNKKNRINLPGAILGGHAVYHAMLAFTGVRCGVVCGR